MNEPVMMNQTNERWYIIGLVYTKKEKRDFAGGAVVKNPPVNVGDTGLSPGLERSHVPRSN